MPSAPILFSYQDNVLTPSEEPLSLPASVPYSSSPFKMTRSSLNFVPDTITALRVKRHSESDGKRLVMPRFNKMASREASKFYLNNSEDDGDEDEPMSAKHKRQESYSGDAGLTTPTRIRSMATSLSKLNIAAEFVQKDGVTEIRRGRSREVSKRALVAKEKAKFRQAHVSSS